MPGNNGDHDVANISTAELSWTFYQPAPQAVMELCLRKGHRLDQSFCLSKRPKMLCLIFSHFVFFPSHVFLYQCALVPKNHTVFFTHTHFLKHLLHPALLSSCLSAFPWSAELMLCLPGYPQITHKRGVRARLMRFFPWSSAKKSSSSNQSKSDPDCFHVHLVWRVCLLSKTVNLFAASVLICSGDFTLKI